VIADHAEPKSIKEIKDAWINILPCEKWADSVIFWTKTLSEQKISYTKRSKNLKYEYENYAWKEDKSWEPTGETTWPDHLLDCARYWVCNDLWNKESDFDYETFEQNELQHAKNVYNNLGIGEY
jgi:phage terminase large subunit